MSYFPNTMNTGIQLHKIRALETASELLLLRDRESIRGLLRTAHQRVRRNQPVERTIAQLEERIAKAQERVDKRLATSLVVSYPDALPVSGKQEEICQTIRDNQVVIVCGTTGSGKTTQLPKMALDAGLGKTGRIGVTQPRRLAATGMARRVAEEMQSEYGHGVGCQVRFDDQTCDETVIKFMTDGILLAETQRDRKLLQYDCLIIDEAHERSLNIDFILGYLKNLLRARPDLKIIISSATLDAESFSKFFNDAPVIEVEGRTFPVEDFFLPPEKDEDLSNHIVRAMRWVTDIDDRGDVLIFLPGEREIRDATKKLAGQHWKSTEVLPLFGRLSMGEQQRVFKVGGRRRIILATNVAETSITIPGIQYVIDSGRVRLSRYSPRTQVQGLQIEQVSQASARQRRGRCGRVSNGICIYLYDEETLKNSAEYTDPEIRRTSLAGVILQMDMLNLPPINEFPLLDPPSSALVREGYKTLYDIGAIDESQKLTPLGRDIAAFPVDPHLARMLVQAHEEGVLEELLILVAFLSIQDVRERPAEQADAADLAHKKWLDPTSDFSSILTMWNFLENARTEGASHGAMRRLCKKNFINYRRVQEWSNLIRDLRSTIRTLRWKISDKTIAAGGQHDPIHRSLLAGLPSNIGVKGEKAEFIGARDRHFFIFPGSALFKKPPQWVMTFSLVDTTRLYARTVASIDPGWLKDVAPHLCKSVYKKPNWNGQNGFVYAKESIVSGGLQLIDERRVHYGPICPEESRKIFIRDGLVPGDLQTRGGWLKLHQAMLEEIHSREEKLRRPGALLDNEAIFEHFDALIPSNVHSVPTLEQWLRKTKTRIAMDIEDAMFQQTDPMSRDHFPSQISFSNDQFQLLYTFEPGDELDGVAMVCPADKIATLPSWATDWLIPGRLEEKVIALMRTLPKNLRMRITPIAQTAKEFVESLDGAPDCSLLDALSLFLQRTHQLPVDAGDFDEAALPDDLKMKIIETKGDDIVQVHTQLSDKDRHAARKTGALTAFSKWMRRGEPNWPGAALPAHVISVDGHETKGFPALSPEIGGVGVDVLLSDTDAWFRHREGLVALFRMQQATQVAYVEKRPPIHPLIQLSLSAIDDDFLTDFFDAAIFIALTDDNALDIRDADTFAKRSDEARGTLYETAGELATILTQMIELRETVANATAALFDTDARHDLDMQMAFLFRPGFLKTHDVFDRYPRYLKAMKLRLDRLVNNPAADTNKMAEINPFQNRLNEKMLEVPNVSESYDLIETAMLLEEFRVNRFAPEIKSTVKASAKRLEKSFEALEQTTGKKMDKKPAPPAASKKPAAPKPKAPTRTITNLFDL